MRVFRAQSPAHLEAIDTREHEIEYDEIRREAPSRVERREPVRRIRRVDPVASKVGDDHLGDGRIVIDDENTRHTSQRRHRPAMRQPRSVDVTHS